MEVSTIILLAVSFFAVAVLYASVGHAGASGYLTVMALAGLAPALMKPTALTLNLLVATIGAVKFYRAGYFSWSIFLPFAAGSIPFAFLGGKLTLTDATYKALTGAVLLFAAWRLFQYAKSDAVKAVKTIPLYASVPMGAGLGLLSGLTGVGGGIFLSPLLVFMGWAEMRQIAGIAAMFILVNSIAGLAGIWVSAPATLKLLPSALPVFLLAAGAGGWIGSEYGVKKLASPTLRKLIAVAMAIAAFKMLWESGSAFYK